MQVNITNGTLTSLQETLSPSTNYSLPNSITVTGATSNYNSSTGDITLTNLTQTMSITASGEPTDINNVFIGTLKLAKAFIGNTEVSSMWLGNVKLYEKPQPSGYTLTSNFTAQSTSGWDTHIYIYETDNDDVLGPYNYYHFSDATLLDTLTPTGGTFVSGTKTYNITKKYICIGFDGAYGLTPYVNIISNTNCYTDNQIRMDNHAYQYYIFTNFTGNPTITWEAGDND